jgi:hypothetical protein
MVFAEVTLLRIYGHSAVVEAGHEAVDMLSGVLRND